MVIPAAQEIASRQHGVVARRQLLSVGIPNQTISYWTVKQFLVPVFPAVYAVGRGQIDRRGLWMAGVLNAGDGAVLARRSAAAAWGVMDLRPSVEVVRHRHRFGLRSDVEVEGARRSVSLTVRRTRTLPETDTRVIDAIPLTSMARTIFDLAPSLEWNSLNRVFLEADRLGLIHDEDIAHQLLRTGGRAGAGTFRRLVVHRFEEVRFTRLVLEALFLQLCRQRKIETPEVNVPESGYVPDCIWRRQRLIVELDGAFYHRGYEKAEMDRARDNHLKALGWEVLRFSWRMVVKQPDTVAAQIESILARRN